MRACCSRFRARLSAGMGRQPGNGFWVDVLTTPAAVGAGRLDQGRIAARTPPAFRLVRPLVLIPFLHLVGVPFLHTVEVGYCPANGARPHLGASQHVVSAYDALVLPVIDILVNSRGQVRRCRFRDNPRRRHLRLRYRSWCLRLGTAVSVSLGMENCWRADRPRGQHWLPRDKFRGGSAQCSRPGRTNTCCRARDGWRSASSPMRYHNRALTSSRSSTSPTGLPPSVTSAPSGVAATMRRDIASLTLAGNNNRLRAIHDGLWLSRLDLLGGGIRPPGSTITTSPGPASSASSASVRGALR